jgi:Xaa-Pro aminopeptidase
MSSLIPHPSSLIPHPSSLILHPFFMNYPPQRRQTLAQTLTKNSLDAFLVTKPENVTYLTGFTGDSSFYIGAAKNGILVSDTRFEEQIKEECPNLDAAIRGHNKTTHQAAAEVLNNSGAKSIGVESNHLTIGELELFKTLVPNATFVPMSGTIEAQRAIKDASEIDMIRAAVRIAERAFRMFTATVRETDSEKEMVDAMEGFVRRAGGRWTAFPPIIAVGERGALPHAPPGNKRLEEGSQLLVDWGADLLYKSDLTRTLRNPPGTTHTREKRDKQLQYDFAEIYEAVLQAQTAAMKAVKPGVNAKDVDAAARCVFASTRLKKHPEMKLEDYFTHGLGHGIGLEIHEAPRVRANSDDVLESGMVITLEPGIYIPEWGGVRIEDDFLITPDGAILLTSLPRGLDAATTA